MRFNFKTSDGTKIHIGGTGVLSWIVGGLLAGWILSWFGFDNVFIKAMAEMFDLKVSTVSYYCVFGVLGVISGWVNAGKRPRDEN